MSRLPVPGQDDGTWGEILNDFLNQAHNPDGSLKDVGVLAAKYVKPAGGIPEGDLSSAVQTKLNSGGADATTTTKGVMQLAGDLGGTAASPTVPGLAGKANNTTVVHIAGAETITGAKNFTGGATINGTNIVVTSDSRLSDQRVPTDASVTDAKIATTLSPSKITGTAVITTDPRLSDARTPTGSAGGDLTGTYPNPTLAINRMKALNPTAVKTADYSAAANDLVPVDTTSGVVTVTLPTAPADGTLLAVKLVVQGGTNTVTVAAGVSDVFNKTSGSTTLTLTLPNQALLLQYKASGAIWYVLADDLSLSQLDSRYLKASNNLSDVPIPATARTNLGLGNVDNTSDATKNAAVAALTNKDLTGTGNTFPTFNQNTSGSAANWTTARNLAGNSVDGSTNVAFANKFIVQGTADSGLSGAQFLGALSTGIMVVTTTTGIVTSVAAPAGTIVGTSDTQTLTNKRLTPRTGTITSSATPTINTDTVDLFSITALSTAITSFTTNLSGTPTNGQKLLIRIKDDGTARAVTWGASFVSSGIASLLSTTVISKTHTIGLMYDSVSALWVCLAVDAVGY